MVTVVFRIYVITSTFFLRFSKSKIQKVVTFYVFFVVFRMFSRTMLYTWQILRQNLYADKDKGAQALFVLVSFSGYVC